MLYPDQESARVYLESRMWPDGIRCPFCASDRINIRKGGYYRCLACEDGENFTARTNTVMERSKIPLHKWVYAMYLLITARKGISCMQLAKEIGVTKKSAWFMLHRLREACDPRQAAHLQKTHRRGGCVMSKPPVPPELDRVADVVLAYRPKPKSKAAKKRARRKKRLLTLAAH